MSEFTEIRRPLGKAWDDHLYVGDVLKAYEVHEDFEAMRDAFVAQARAMPMYQRRVDAQVVAQAYDTFVDIIDSLAQSDDEEEFQGYLNDLYDWGDEGKRLWIETSF